MLQLGLILSPSVCLFLKSVHGIKAEISDPNNLIQIVPHRLLKIIHMKSEFWWLVSQNALRMMHITIFPFKKTIYKYLYLTCWKHHVQSGGACFSLLNLPFTGKCTAQVFLSKLCAWGKLHLALSVGDTRAQSAITNNYCTEGRGGASAWKAAHMLARLNVKVIEWGFIE